MNPETVGGRIRKVRGSLSQAEFSSRLAVHEQTVGKYERDKRLPDAEFLSRLREEFGTDINWLLTGQAAEPDFDARLDAIEKLLETEEVPVAPERLRERPDLEDARQVLRAVAQDTGAPQRTRARADMMLSVAFGDEEAEERRDERLEEVGAQLRETRRRVAEAVKIAGWEPPRYAVEVLATIAFRYDVALEDLVHLVQAFRLAVENR